MNQSYQGFQSQLKSALNEMMEPGMTTNPKLIYESKIQRLLSDYSFEMNRLEASYLERYESSLNDISNKNFIPNPRDTSPVIHSSHIRQCEHCGETFNRDCDLYGHIRSKHNLPPFACDIDGCSATFHWHKEFQKHRESHSKCQQKSKSMKVEQYRCDVCSKSMPTARTLREHYIQLHTVETPFHCDYSGCDKAFKIKRFLNHHLRTDHDGYPYPCPDPQCDEAFKYKREMEGHCKLTHGFTVKRRRPPRDKCFVSDNSDNNFGLRPIKRRKLNTESVTQYQCPYRGCDRTWTLRTSMDYHIRTVHNGKPFSCSICGEKFKYHQEMAVHCKSVHKTNSIQESSTSSQWSSDSESEEESETSDSTVFQCSICDKVLANQTMLKNHELLHSAERPYKCDLCDSAFVVKKRLNHHLIHVHKVKPYRCNRCNEGYTKGKESMLHYIDCRETVKSDIETNTEMEEPLNGVIGNQESQLNQETTTTAELECKSKMTRSTFNPRL